MIITLPRQYATWMSDESPSVAVEHAAVPRPRINEAALTLSVANFFTGLNVVILTPNARRFKELAMFLFPYEVTPTSTARNVIIFRNYDSTLTLIDSDLDLRDLPMIKADRLVVLESHLVESNIWNILRRTSKRTLAIGEPTHKGSWFYDHSRTVSLHRISADVIVDAYPDQSVHVLPDSDPQSGRLMRCEDDRGLRTGSFTKFARRLRVRTDKGPEFLSAGQLAEAKSQWVGSAGRVAVVPFEMTRMQRTYVHKKLRTQRAGKKPWFLLLKYRRGGFTTLEQAMNYRTATQHPSSYVACLADTAEKTARIFRIAKLYWEHDPQAPKLVSDTSGRLEFANRSLYYIGTAGSSGFARGDTLQRVHGSEVSSWCGRNRERVEELMAGILGAAESGEIVLETTARGVEWFCETYRAAKRGENDFTPVFLPWFADPANRLPVADEDEIWDTITDEERRLKLDAQQIAFRRDRKRAFGRLFPQEYPEDDDTCFIVSGTLFFDWERVSTLIDSLEHPLGPDSIPVGATSRKGGWYIEYEEPIAGEEYCLGHDASEGLPGCDPNGFGIIHRGSGRQVAALHGYFDLRSQAEEILAAWKRWPRLLIGIERENHGHAVLARVIDGGCHRPHYEGGPLFYFTKDTGDDRKSKVAKAGWSTNAVTRPVMLDGLADILDSPDAPTIIKDALMLKECATFRLQSSGRFDHDAGAHDDSIMKWAIAYQMRQSKRPRGRITLV